MILVWDKISDINGVSEIDVKKSNNIKEDDEVFLIVDDLTGRVKEIHIKSIICTNYNIDINNSCLDVAQRYLEIREKQDNEQQQEQITLEQQAVKISILEQQNSQLETALVELASIVGGV